MAYPLFSLNWKKNYYFLIINNYHIVHQKNHIEKNNDGTFN